MSWVDAQQLERDRSEESQQLERDRLEKSIQDAMDLLPCDKTIEEVNQIGAQLSKSMNTLTLRNDLKTAQSIFDNVTDDLMECSPPGLFEPEPQLEPDYEPPSTEVPTETPSPPCSS